MTVVEDGPLLVRLRWGVTINEGSSLLQDIELRANTPYLIFATSVEWQETHKILKVMVALYLGRTMLKQNLIN